MGAQYHLWSADEVESLIQTRYGHLWITYVLLPFAVQRMHIARVAIVHCYGGMYVGLGMLPNRDTFDQAALAIQYCHEQFPSMQFDMQVFIADAGSHFLEEFLYYLQNRYDERSYSNKRGWQRCRDHKDFFLLFLRSWTHQEQRHYISLTTGDRSTNEFWKSKETAKTLSVVKFLSVTKDADPAVGDVLDCSPAVGDGPAFSPAVGDGQGPVPVLDGSQPSVMLRRRFKGKRKANAIDCVQNPRRTRKVAILAAPVEVVGSLAPPTEKGKVAGLHYFLRSPVKGDGSQPVHDDDVQVKRKKPLLLFLHGTGERGDQDGIDLHQVQTHGPWHCHGANGFFILAPQCPTARVWPVLVNEVLLVLKHVCERHDVDKSRLYISGLSMGAFGAWAIAASQPQMFAAIVSVCGGVIGTRMALETTRSEMLRLANGQFAAEAHAAIERCKYMPAWIFHGDADTTVLPICSKHILEGLAPDNEHVRTTFYQGVKHGCWGRAYKTMDLYTWLLKHARVNA